MFLSTFFRWIEHTLLKRLDSPLALKYLFRHIFSISKDAQSNGTLLWILANVESA